MHFTYKCISSGNHIEGTNIIYIKILRYDCLIMYQFSMATKTDAEKTRFFPLFSTHSDECSEHENQETKCCMVLSRAQQGISNEYTVRETDQWCNAHKIFMHWDIYAFTSLARSFSRASFVCWFNRSFIRSYDHPPSMRPCNVILFKGWFILHFAWK